ncbi:hypothetical protein Aaci_0960 [Alicyclobacillus acidocaldarius subsp. acidocaldarius DSM 446]|uniref:Uncharacterized protein n=2 Tax=Alicyclobacillus acidocaldarius TaxID=405212 RepID=C8WV11_ALIAD|nr:hypothetical protein Aaci_0960 [Alicyclobacillus acidocaldarius subsp. acidocaldarius DSM 446]
MMYWIIVLSVLAALIAAYTAFYFWARKRQRQFDEQFLAHKQRFEVFVLSKRRVRERGKQGIARFVPLTTYQVVGRVTLGQTMKGLHVHRTANVTFRTTKEEYDKIEVNRKYRMDIAGDFIGNVVAEVTNKRRRELERKRQEETASRGKSVRRFSFARRKPD